MIKMLVMDVDGTLTDGKIYMGPDGEVMKAFDIKDGYAIANMLPRKGILPVIITGRNSAIVQNRADELGIREIYQAVPNKLEKMCEIAERHGIQREEIAYIGDDLNDLECIEFAAVSGCPADAVHGVASKVSYVCRKMGGNGAVREFIEYIISL